MYYFKFPEGYSTVHVVATSPDKSGCAIVSVQNATVSNISIHSSIYLSVSLVSRK